MKKGKVDNERWMTKSTFWDDKERRKKNWVKERRKKVKKRKKEKRKKSEEKKENKWRWTAKTAKKIECREE